MEDCDPRLRRTIQVLLAFAGGIPIAEIQRAHTIASSSIYRIVAVAEEGGVSAMIAYGARRVYRRREKAGES
jgi:hypothetical protein